MPKNELNEIHSKIETLQQQLDQLKRLETPVDVDGTPEEILACATNQVARRQEEQVILGAIASLKTLLYIKEQEEKTKTAQAALDVIKRQGRIAAQKLEDARVALVELQQVATPHLRGCSETFGQLALQNRLPMNAGFPCVEILDKCVVISTRYQ